MSDFLVYAARLQDAGVEHLSVRIWTAKDRTRMMRVKPHSRYANDEDRWPARDFELCGTDRVLERLKDDMVYSDDGPTPEKVLAAITSHPLLRDDLNEWYADWLLVKMPTDEELEDAAEQIPEGEILRSAERMKAMLRGLDIARQRDAMAADTPKAQGVEP